MAAGIFPGDPSLYNPPGPEELRLDRPHLDAGTEVGDQHRH